VDRESADSVPCSSTKLLPLFSESTECPSSDNPKPSTSPSTKRSNSLTITTLSLVKVHVESFSPEQSLPCAPDQPTLPKDSVYSGDLAESTDEEIQGKFIHTTLYHLGEDFRKVSWPSYAISSRASMLAPRDQRRHVPAF
jgi:hypothetical protein